MPYYYDDRQSGIGGFLNRFPPVTRNILLINIVMYKIGRASCRERV